MNPPNPLEETQRKLISFTMLGILLSVRLHANMRFEPTKLEGVLSPLILQPSGVNGPWGGAQMFGKTCILQKHAYRH